MVTQCLLNMDLTNQIRIGLFRHIVRFTQQIGNMGRV
ncbi:Uncharacterised protein [Vibrio cholerae]|nr:Uncharacterised protein [Vibrio cholerae]CSI50351.1 Uncharacterised protein [Vibrio cholerae]